MNQRQGIIAVAAAIAITLGMPASAAQQASAGLTVTGNFGVSIFADSVRSERDGSTAASASLNPALNYIDVGALGFARPGLLRVYAKADSNVPGSDNFRTQLASAEALWTTSAVMNVPGVAPGTAGTATARLAFDGSLYWDHQGTNALYRGVGSLYGDFRVGGARSTAQYAGRFQWDTGSGFWRVTRSRSGESDVNVVYTDSPSGFGSYGFNEVLEVTFPFVTGQAVDIRALMRARGESASSRAGAGLDWTSDAGNSAYWEGISNVTIGGQSVDNFSFLDLGTGEELALATPIPLPAPLALFAAAIACVHGAARRRR